MLLSILKNAIISVILIFLLHYIYDYFKTNLTIPKVKDLVNKPQFQYNEIINSINESKKNINIENKKEKEKKSSNMKDELKKYMETLNDDDDIPNGLSNTNLF
tara:strand:+ start:205 stop:513 length:309 start_codon:yes stop_codon:yes gene_type:complete